MTNKAAAAGLNLGGGKAVIIGDPKKDKSEALFRAFGKCVNSLGGRYITAEDVGTDVNDMEYVYMETPYVTGIHSDHGGSGDPSPFTAYGTLQGMRAAVEKQFGTDLKGRSVSVQGLGHVGMELARLLKREGAKVIATDIDAESCQRAKDEAGVDEIVKPEEIYDVAVDVFAPCALGAVVNDRTVETLKCKVIAGAANNQLEDSDRHCEVLEKRGILYTPDYVINAGGLINVYLEIKGYNVKQARRLCRGIYYNCMKIFKIAAEKEITSHHAAEHMVSRRMNSLAGLSTHFNTYGASKGRADIRAGR